MAIDDNADYTLTGAQVKDLAARIKAGGGGMIVYVDESFASPSSITSVFSDSALTTPADPDAMADAISAGGTVGVVYDGGQAQEYIELSSVNSNNRIPEVGKTFTSTISTSVVFSAPTVVTLVYNGVSGNWSVETTSVPTKTSDITNDGSDGTSTYVEADDLATVATTGDYNDLSNLPSDRLYRMLVPEGTEITSNKNLNTTEFLKVDKYYCPSNATVSTLTNCPTGDAFMMEVLSPLSTTIDNETTGTWVYRTRLITTFTGELYIQTASSGSTPGSFTYGGWKRYDNVNDATLTIQKNGTTVQTFTANASSNVTANITVPTQFSDLSGTVATAQIANNAVTKAKVDDSGLQHPSVSGANCYYRRSGHFVWVSGAASGFALSANNYKTIFTLPSGYRPPIDIYCPLGLSSATKMGILRIRTSGEVQGWADSNTSYWNFNTTFAIN